VPKRVELNTDLNVGLPVVEANPAQLRQVVINLINNAADAIGERSGVIAMRTSRVMIPRPEGGTCCYVELTVSDSGCGIDPTNRHRIFDPFFTTKPAGHGLGLAIVNRIVREVGGHIHFETEVKRGTTFQILLPAHERAEAAATTMPTGEADERNLVLVVEDEAPLRSAAAKILRAHSCSILEASDGTTALSLVREHWPSLGAILLDITLPGASSGQVFAEARRLRPDVKIVITSAYGRTKVDECFPGMQIDAFIRKPYRLAELAALMSAVLTQNKPV
jgi:two-component system, cell cycle sensor histidine kinase and response regulator CckA